MTDTPISTTTKTANNRGCKIAACTGAALSGMLGVFLCCAVAAGAVTGVVFLRAGSRDTDQATGVEIITDIEPDMFPEGWRHPPASVQATRLRPEEVERSVRIVKSALEKYPPALVKQNLKKVYVVDTLVFYGASIGGTYATGKVYLVNTGIVDGYTDQFIERAFHEEYSSILFRTHSTYFRRAAWTAINPPDFVYGTSGYDPARDDFVALVYDPELNAEGFVHLYATTDLENDFNAIASRLFVGEEEFWQIADEYGKIKEKMLLVIDFYRQIDPMFTEEYFRALRLKAE